MSDAISKLRRLGFGGNDQQQVNQAQSVSDQGSAPQLPGQTMPRLDRLVPAGSPRFLSMLAELDGLSEIERAIVASRLVKRDDPILELKPEDWVSPNQEEDR